jgi:hypothetical protein
MLGSELSMSRHQITSTNHITNIPNTSFENLAKFDSFGAIITSQYQIHIRKQIKSRLNSADPCYRSVPNLLSFGHLSNGLEIREYGRRDPSC